MNLHLVIFIIVFLTKYDYIMKFPNPVKSLKISLSLHFNKTVKFLQIPGSFNHDQQKDIKN